MSHNIANTSTSTSAPTASLPTIEEINGWDRDRVKKFLQAKSTELELEEKDIDIIYSKKVSGKAFLRLTEEQLTRVPGTFQLDYTPASAIAELVKQIKGDQPSADGDLTRFIQALKNTTFDVTTNNNLFELNEGANFFGLNNQPSKMYIRNCYSDLLKIVQNDKRKLRISGNPGIGKTFFGYYLLYNLVKNNATVVYDLHNMKNEVMVFTGDKGFYVNEADKKTIRKYLYNKDTWYIVDGKAPDEAVAKTVLICSPRKSHHHDFDKGNPDIRIMPVWTWEEIDYCRRIIYKDLNEELVKELYIKWGGIPRFILQSARNKTIQLKLQQAIDTCDESVIQCIGGSDSNQDVSHVLVHIWTNIPGDNESDIGGSIEVTESEGEVECVVEEYYTQTIIKYASDYVGEMITHKLKDSIVNRLQVEVEACLGSGQSSKNSYYGCFFEQIVHRMFRNGGTFRVRSLESDNRNIPPITLPRQDQILKFSRVEAIEDNKYYQPESQTFPTVDSIIAPDKLFQITIATDHPIKLIGLNLLKEKLAKNKRIEFYFAVPAGLFDSYQRQNFITTSDTSARRLPSWIRNYVNQYVLEINLSVRSGNIDRPRILESGAHTRVRAEDQSRRKSYDREPYSNRRDRESHEHDRSHDRDSPRRYDRDPGSRRNFGSGGDSFRPGSRSKKRQYHE